MGMKSDFRELLALLGEHRVEHVIVGAHALAHHGAPRFTGDLDILIRPSSENAQRLLRALNAFGFGSLDLSEEDFIAEDVVVQLGLPPVRIDLLTSLTGVTWEQAWSGRDTTVSDGQSIAFLGKAELITNKRAIGRLKDLADLEALGETE